MMPPFGFFTRIRPRRKKTTVFATRPRYALVCLCCGAAHSRDADWCASCGAPFLFLDETNRYG